MGAPRLFIQLFFFLFSLWFTSCNLFDPEEPLPVYISIDSITVTTDYQNEGSASSKVADAWVYIDDNPVGVFELPAYVPVLASGKTNIKIFPGIKNSGITEFRKQYIPYTAFELDTTLTEGTAVRINPVLGYDDILEFAWLEDFEDISISIDSVFPSETKVTRTTEYLKERSGSGLVKLNRTSPLLFKGVNSRLLDLPRTGQDTYLEMDYLCNQEFIVGLRAFGTRSIQDNDLVTITPTNKDGNLKWNKLYIEMTDMLQNTNLAIGHQVYFQAIHDSTLSGDGIIAFDNLKVLHLP